MAKLLLLTKEMKRETRIPSVKSTVGEFLVMLFKVLMSVFYPFSVEAQLQAKVKDIYGSSSSEVSVDEKEEQRRLEAIVCRLGEDPGFKAQRQATDTALVVLASAALFTFLDYEYMLQKYVSLGDLVKAEAPDVNFTSEQQGILLAKQNLLDECANRVLKICSSWTATQQMGSLPPFLLRCQMGVQVMSDKRYPDRSGYFD